MESETLIRSVLGLELRELVENVEVSPPEPLPKPASLQLVIDLAMSSSRVTTTDVGADHHLEKSDWGHTSPPPSKLGSSAQTGFNLFTSDENLHPVEVIKLVSRP